jgi:DNA-binding response OmpR family regulator
VVAKKILIVEDDPVTRQIFHTLLKSTYQTFISGDAMAAFTEARKQQPDLVILDLGLPAGGGFTVLQRLKSIPALALIPVLVVSGLDRAANEQRALEAGAVGYMQKPVSNDALFAEVKRILGD